MGTIINEQNPGLGPKANASAAARTTQQTADNGEVDAVADKVHNTLHLLFSGQIGFILQAPHVLPEGALAIGRAPAADGIWLADDGRVSKTHATVITRDGSSVIVDSDSRNGVFVNGVRQKEATLNDGDLIRVGNSFLLFRVSPGTSVSRDGSDANHSAMAPLLGRSPAMCSLRQTILQAGPTDLFIVLLGESGTGKELVAQALHGLSDRAKERFMDVNCATIPESLAESQLFGHDKGAFTGADRSEGIFRAANRGTLFLDEIGDLPRSIQAKLLRAIEDQRVTPVGATRQIDVNVRIIAATNRDLVDDINQHEFRGDLFFRLAGLTIDLPPLRDRKEDILPILLSAWSKDPPRLAPDLVNALLLHPWPYNVRELLKIAQQLQVKSHGLKKKELELDLVSEQLAMNKRLVVGREVQRADPPPPLRDVGSQIPGREELLDLLRRHNGNISAIARERSKSRTQIERWLIARRVNKNLF